MERIRTGVIGLGRMGRHHCRVYATQREAQLIGVHDINHNTAEEYARIYEAEVFDQVDDLLSNVDAVSIVTPTPTHFELVRRCLAHKVHVLVEKPITDSIEQAEELARLAESSGLVVQVGHIERFNPTFIELKYVLESLKVLALNFRRLSPYRVSNKDVDVVLDLMVHDLDLCIDLIGSDPLSISACGVRPFSDGLDHVTAQLHYVRGPIVTLTASRVTEEKIRSVDVTAEEAFVEADLHNKNIYIHRYSTGEYSAQVNHSVKYQQESMIQRILVPNAEPLALEIKHFLNCISQGCSPNVSVLAGVRALQLAERIRTQAHQLGRELATQTEYSQPIQMSEKTEYAHTNTSDR